MAPGFRLRLWESELVKWTRPRSSYSLYVVQIMAKGKSNAGSISQNSAQKEKVTQLSMLTLFSRVPLN